MATATLECRLSLDSQDHEIDNPTASLKVNSFSPGGRKNVVRQNVARPPMSAEGRRSPLHAWKRPFSARPQAMNGGGLVDGYHTAWGSFAFPAVEAVTLVAAGRAIRPATAGGLVPSVPLVVAAEEGKPGELE